MGELRRKWPADREVLSVLVKLMLAASLLATGVAVAPGASACSLIPVSVVEVESPTLHVELSADRTSYRRGERATLRVTVTQGVVGGPPVRDAVTEVDLTVGSRRVKRVGGSTKEDGRLVLSFVVPRTAPVGRVKAVAMSRARIVVGPECEDLIYATGSVTVDPLMTIKP